MQDWRRRKGVMRPVRFTTVFEPMEREVLGNLASTVAETLIQRVRSAPEDELAEMAGMASGHTEAPEDPALARLLPDFEQAGDEQFDGDNGLLRSLHETDICRSKLENLMVVTEALGPTGGVQVSLTEEQAQSWVAAVNDLRLYLAAGAGIDGTSGFPTDMGAPGQSTKETEDLVQWLGYNQNSLLEALMDNL